MLSGCGNSKSIDDYATNEGYEQNTDVTGNGKGIAKEIIKVGVLHISDPAEGSGYSYTHDIGIHLCEEKYGKCNGKLQEKEGPALAKKLLEELGFDCDVSERVQYLIAHHHTYDNIDGIDYQILLEADFLVNIMEDGLSKEAALKVYHRIFKTECGKKICKEMFDIC